MNRTNPFSTKSLSSHLVVPALAGVMVVAACSGDNGGADAGTNKDATATQDDATGFADARPDSGVPDTGPRDTGPRPDVGPIDYGKKMTGVAASALVGMTPDETRAYFMELSGQVIALKYFDVAAQQTNATSIQLGQFDVMSRPLPNIWYSQNATDPAAGPPTGNLMVLKVPSTTTVSVVAGVAIGAYGISENGTGVLAARNIQTNGATTTADLVLSNDSGQIRPVLSGINLGTWVWDAQAGDGDWAPQCRMSFVQPDANTVFAALCPDATTPRADARTLIRVDVSTGQTKTISRRVSGFMSLGADKSFVVWLGADKKIKAVNVAGTTTSTLTESGDVISFGFLDGKRFAYVAEVAQATSLKVASFPSMTPTTLTGAAGAAIVADVSPSGQHLMYLVNQNAQQGLGDLYLIGTTTASQPSPVTLSQPTTAYPGDDPFSKNGDRAYWYMNTDQSFVGDIMSLGTSGGGQPVQVIQGAWYVLNYSDPASVLLMANLVGLGGQTPTGDISVRKADGSAPAKLVVPGVATSGFQISPNGNKFLYRIRSGPNQGLWIRDLPQG